MKLKKLLIPLIASISFSTTLASCSPFIFIEGDNSTSNEVVGEGTRNTMFFALYNYYGIEGQHFTNRWLGMKDALENHGIKVTNDANEKDARKFKIDMTNSDLPEDTEIYMVNNQTWDTGLQFTKPLTNKQPLAVISTCNGVEFASAQIKANSPKTQNATMGGFSKLYGDAFLDGSLNYLATKYTCHVAPIFAACVDAVDGTPLRTKNNEALHLSVEHWDIKSIDEYQKHREIDNYSDNPTIKKSDLDRFFNATSEDFDAEKLTNWCSKSSYEDIKAIYDANREAPDVKREGRKIKAGLIVPGSVNDVVQAYIDYMRGYLADVYNVEFVTNQNVTTSNDQPTACKALINSGVEFIISLQDDTNRNKAIKLANENGVYFANAGTCQNDKDYAEVKDLKYFVGSIGSSINEERRATRVMTEYYLSIIKERGVVSE